MSYKTLESIKFSNIFKTIYPPWHFSILFLISKNPENITDKIIAEHVENFLTDQKEYALLGGTTDPIKLQNVLKNVRKLLIQNRQLFFKIMFINRLT
jgi:hypothetical protein